MSRNPSQLFLLADHIKLSLLERQRAISLNLEPNTQDGQISRSLDSLRDGIEALESQAQQWDDPLHPSEEQATTTEQLSRLKQQHSELSSQFHGSSSSPLTSPTLTTPNNPSLSSDFARATSNKPTKSVRFTDSSSYNDDDPNRQSLFPPGRYTDDPDTAPDQSHLTNQQIHAYHSQVMAQQDEQLDVLGESIGRQRDLSIQIGDELESQVVMLDEVDERVDRHQGQLDRAKGRLGKVARKARENWSLTTIVVLIVILVLLIIITKR